MWSSSLFLVCLVKALKIFSQDRVHPLLLTIQLVILKLWMSLGKWFFCTFPKIKKSANLGPHSSRRVHAGVSSSTPAPHHRTRLWEWVMILTDQGPYYWDRRTGETRWTMEDGYSPSWLLRPDGRHVRLGNGEIYETLDGL